MIFFGFSQTSTFRELLRENVIKLANKELNGKLNIGKIDGTIFTSLVLRNTVVNMGSDTLLNAGVIELKVSPLQLFLKRIYIRKVEISNARIAFVADSTGELNISKLLPPVKKDTTHSKFPFKILAPDVKLTNVSFSLQDYNLVNSSQSYETLNTHDLRIKDLNLSLSALANIADNEYEVRINNFSFTPNLEDFQLKNLSGELIADTNGIFVNDLNLVTNSTDLTLTARINNFNLFDSTAFSKINSAGINVNLKADKFNFDELTSFVPATSILNGIVAVDIDASGSLKDLNLNHAEIKYLDTRLELKGKVRDVTDPNRMFIDANFINTKIKESDADKLLPSIGIPVYNEIGTVTFDTLTYRGNPFNFYVKAFLKSDKGNANIDGSLDLRKPGTAYDINFATRNLDLSPFTGLTTNLNSRGSIKGSGFSPENMNSVIKFIGDGSSISGNKIDTLRFSSATENKNISYNLVVRSDTAAANLSGNFNFSNKDKPSYNLHGDIKGLNLADFSKDTSMKSNLNLQLNGSGDNFDLDKMDLYLVLDLKKSSIREVNIDSSKAIADIRSNDNGERVINLISDLADLTVIGNFSVKQSIDLISKEANLISTSIQKKISEIKHPDSVFNRQENIGVAVKANKHIKKIPRTEKTNFKYYVEFKNLDLLSAFLGSNHLDLDGDISGEFKDDSGNIAASLNTNLNYFKFWGPNNVFFFSNLNMKLGLANNIDSTSLSGINSKLNLSADRIFTGKDFFNLKFDLNLAKNIADINFAANMQKNSMAKLSGKINLINSSVLLNLDTLYLRYNKFDIANKGNVKINYSKDRIVIDNFDLVRNESEIGIKGFLSRAGSQDFNIDMKGINGKDLSTNLLEMNPENSIDSKIYLDAKITGNFDSPIGTLKFGADSVTYKNRYFGSLSGVLNYAEQNLSVYISFLNSDILSTAQAKNIKPSLLINGNIPIDLSFTGGGDRFVKSKQIDLNISSQDFDLSPLGNALPGIQKLTGKMIANLKIAGTPDNLDPSGDISVQDATFLVNANNIEYTAGIKLLVKNQTLTLDSLLIENLPGTSGGGRIIGGGIANLKNFNLTSAHAKVSGSLKVLSEDSKAVSPAVFGDLVIQTDGDIEYTMNEKKSFLKAPIIVKEAMLTFPPTQSAYQTSGNNFIYKFSSDTVKPSKIQTDFENLIQLSKESNGENNIGQNSSKLTLDYSINVKVQNEAALKFVLAKEFNQNLTAILKGNIQIDHINGRSTSQGELTLLDGSTFQFLKSFEATGTIRFESDLSNPYLNIVSVYKNYYTPPEPDAKEEPVEVRIKLNGPLSDLSKNFTQDKNNIGVYVGSDNISNDKSDPTKDVSDVVMFILTGKFNSDLTAQQQTQAVTQAGYVKSSDSFWSGAAQSTVNSVAGSLLGGVLNRYLGDYVKGVELRSVGSTTKFNLVGKVKDFRYTIGGSTDVFSDLSQANVMIEYPIFKNFLLRIERKEAITQTSISNEMINELGLKYRFEF